MLCLICLNVAQLHCNLSCSYCLEFSELLLESLEEPGKQNFELSYIDGKNTDSDAFGRTTL